MVPAGSNAHGVRPCAAAVAMAPRVPGGAGPRNEDLDQIELGTEVVHARVVRPDFVGLREMGLTCLRLNDYATMDRLGGWCPGRSCQVIA